MSSEQLRFAILSERLIRIEAKLDELLAKKKPKTSDSNIIDAKFNSAFDVFWETYPMKKGKKSAKSAFSRIATRLHVVIEADISDRLAHDRQWIAGYVPNPATYLNGERWNDEIQLIPEQADSLPKADEKLQDWAIGHGYRASNPGESYGDYRHYLTGRMR